MYATYKMQGPSQPTFTLGYANNSAEPIDFSTDNVKAYFRGVQVPIYTYPERVNEIRSEKQGKQIALAILGGLAAGAAAYSSSHQTYRSNYSGSVWNGRNTTSFYGSSTLRVYDPMSGILAGAAVGGATAIGVRQLEYNAANQEQAAESILQPNTVDPQRMVSGDLILRGCCDPYSRNNDVIRFEVTVNSKVHVFEFERVKPGDPLPPGKIVTSPVVAPTAVEMPTTGPAPSPDMPPAGVRKPAPVAFQEPQQVAATPPSPRFQTGAALSERTSDASTSASSLQDQYSAERLVLSQSCTSAPKVVSVAKGPGFESFTVACSNGDTMMIRCDLGKCRVLH